MHTTQSIVFPDLWNILPQAEHLAWQPFRPGIEIYRLYSPEDDGSAAVLLRYQPGMTVPHHRHLGFEHILVLSGSQSDQHGDYPAGTLIVNPPDSHHTVTSKDGCIVLVIWTKPIQIEDS